MAAQIPVKAIYTGSDVTSLGEFASSDDITITYLPTGTSSSTVALGNHVHSYLPLAGGTLTGNLVTTALIDGRDVAADGVLATNAMPKSGGAFTGAITTNSTIDTVDIATRDGVLTTTTTTANAALPKAGGTMTGNIVMGDDTSIGISDSAERIEFDGAGDISFLGANIGIGNSAPSSANNTPLILHLGTSSTTYCGIVFEDDEQKWEIQHNGDMAFRKDTTAHFRVGTTGLSMDAGGGTIPIGKSNTDTSNTGSVTLDFGSYQNHVLTLTGNVTLANPSTEAVGQSGFIAFIQDGTGSRTVALGTDYETAGAAGLTLTATASATDLVPYLVVASGRILLGTPQLAFA